MRTLKNPQTWLMIGIGVLTATTSYWVARADGAPTASPVYYSGVLSDGGAPVSGMRNARVSLWRDATTTAATARACETLAPNTTFDSGHFRIALDDTCIASLRMTPELFVEVEVGGTIIGSRVRIGAVPYSLESDHAVSASTARAGTPLAQQAVPAGAVMAFDLDACPTGWTEIAGMEGRTIVGAGTGSARGTDLGQASVTLSAAQLPAHTHAFTASVPESSCSSSNPGCTQRGLLPGSANSFQTFPIMGTTNPAGTGAAIDIRNPARAFLYCRRS